MKISPEARAAAENARKLIRGEWNNPSDAHTVIETYIQSAIDQATAAKEREGRWKEKCAYATYERDKLLELTWLDLPGEPSESTKAWAAEFEKGWVRKDELTAALELAERYRLVTLQQDARLAAVTAERDAARAEIERLKQQ